MDEDLPPLAGMVFMTSCDAMRRLADAWLAVREDPVHVVDLPADLSDHSIRYLTAGFRELASTLETWGGREVTNEGLHRSIESRDELAGLLARLEGRRARGTLPGGAARLQELHNVASSLSIEGALEAARELLGESLLEKSLGGVPIYLFGNVMPDPETLSMLETCGAHIVDDDLCTGSRWITAMAAVEEEDPFEKLARGLMSRSPCARTVYPPEPGALANEVVRRAKECGARGVLCHTLKFCDPYLARLPGIRKELQKAGLPLLVLEGDCTMRSLGQQRTRIEAFIEMLVS